MIRAPKAPVLPTSDPLDIVGGFGILQLGSPKRGSGRRCTLRPTRTEIMGDARMLDHVRVLFHDLFRPGSEGGLSSPSNGASHNLNEECLVANSLDGRSPLMESSEGTPTNVTMCAVAFAPPQLAPPSQKPSPRPSPS
jgi:hypothetical protein